MRLLILSLFALAVLLAACAQRTIPAMMDENGAPAAPQSPSMGEAPDTAMDEGAGSDAAMVVDDTAARVAETQDGVMDSGVQDDAMTDAGEQDDSMMEP